MVFCLMSIPQLTQQSSVLDIYIVSNFWLLWTRLGSNGKPLKKKKKVLINFAKLPCTAVYTTLNSHHIHLLLGKKNPYIWFYGGGCMKWKDMQRKQFFWLQVSPPSLFDAIVLSSSNLTFKMTGSSSVCSSVTLASVTCVPPPNR